MSLHAWQPRLGICQEAAPRLRVDGHVCAAEHAHFQKGGAFLGGGEVADLVNNRLPVVAHSWLIEIFAGI